MTLLLPGIAVDASGQVTVGSDTGKLLFELALALEDTVSSPVDVEHVLAAMILAARDGRLASDTEMSHSNSKLIAAVREFLPVVFQRYGSDLEDADR